MASHPEFGKETTSEQVVEAFSSQIRGKTILITGISPNGLGAAMALALASQAPSTLILTARSPLKAETVMQKIKHSYPTLDIRVLTLDLSRLASVRQAASELLQTIEKIDILINNAGVMALPERTLSEDGVEMHFATNFLGHFLFTNLILPKLAAHGGRIVNITSAGYAVTPLRFSDYNFDGHSPLPVEERPNYELAGQLGLQGLAGNEGYVPFLAYLHSNTANMLFTTYLAKLKGVEAFSAAPGVVVTDLQRHIPGFRNPVMQYKTASQGVATFLVAALDEGLRGLSGAYLDDCQVVGEVGYAGDEAAAKRLWKLAEDLVRQVFGDA